MNEIKVKFRNVLLSTGSLTPEAIIDDANVHAYEASPEGLTTGLKEKKRGGEELPADFNFSATDVSSQCEFDSKIARKFPGDVSTALSLAYLRYRALSDGFQHSDLNLYISKLFQTRRKEPKLIFNILNGGKHSGNGLSFCEFMIIPKSSSVVSAVQVASEVYNDLRVIITETYGEKDTLVGREGGFAPHISEVDQALGLIISAINRRHENEVNIAIDVAANHITLQNEGRFTYQVNGKELSTDELFSYYKSLILKYPEISYIEDCFHECDFGGWSSMMKEFGEVIDIVADDLTVSNVQYTTQYIDLYNSCILKVNQVGTISDFVETLKFCNQNKIKTIISQRSGETDSNILPHLAVGFGADYMKAGAPARERIIKYNELLRMLS